MIARPTFEAVVAIEEEVGPVVEVAHRLIDVPSFRDMECVLRSCVDSAAHQDIGGLIVRMGTEAAARSALSLALSYFVRGDEAPKPDVDEDRSGPLSFPAKLFVSQAVAVWGQSPSEVWTWTVPEWWAVYDAYVIANGGSREERGGLTDEDKRAIADRLRADERKLRQKSGFAEAQ